jgi:hypothetical protein
MSFLSIYHEELEQNFLYYSDTFNKGMYKHPVNSQIVLQGLFHFMKHADLAKSPTEVTQLFQTLAQIEGVEPVVENTLNLKNGMNYA